MERKSRAIFKIVIILLLVIYANFVEINIFTNKIIAALTLGFSLLFLYKSRKNVPMFIVTFFIFYCNYSIAVGEYFVGGNLGAPLYEVKTIENYGLTIRILLLFTSIVALFYESKNVKLDNYYIKPKDNIVIFYGLYFILLLILIFGIKRGNLTSYTVSITPIYEYSVMLFLFAYLSSGKSKMRKSLLLLLAPVFILQDFYYGGRVTSLQLIFLFLVTMFVKKLSVKIILVGGFAGILINSLVGAYRQAYSLESISFMGVFNNLKDNLFVFDTPVFAYYSSATHVAATPLLSSNEKLTSFFTFLGSIFVGDNFEIGNVTRYVSNNYFFNYGGGLIPTHCYFWFGLLGVTCIAVLVVVILNRIGKGKSDYWKLASIVLIYSAPRWYLYTPISLFRPLFLLLILYLLFKMTHHILFKIAGKKVVINESSLDDNKKTKLLTRKKYIRTWQEHTTQ